MKTLKLNAYFLNLLLSFISIFLSIQNEIKDEFKPKMDKYTDYALEPGKVQMKFINDTNKNPFIFKDEGINNDLLVNFYSLSCNIELSSYTSQNISSLELNGNAISMRINNNSFQTADIIIKEKVSLINGNNKYENKKNCPLIINTIDVSNLSLIVEENDPTSYIALSFSFNDVSKFNFSNYCT